MDTIETTDSSAPVVSDTTKIVVVAAVAVVATSVVAVYGYLGAKMIKAVTETLPVNIPTSL